MRTSTATLSCRLALALLLLLCLPACKTLSNAPLAEPTDRPPRVDCKKQATPPIPPAPGANEWIATVDGVVSLSERAATWIATVLGVTDKERGLRAVEHKCLDALESKGIITQ